MPGPATGFVTRPSASAGGAAAYRFFADSIPFLTDPWPTPITVNGDSPEWLDVQGYSIMSATVKSVAGTFSGNFFGTLDGVNFTVLVPVVGTPPLANTNVGVFVFTNLNYKWVKFTTTALAGASVLITTLVSRI